MLAHADRHGRWARGIIFRKTNSELEELQERAQEIYPKTGATYTYGLRKWVWPNGATLKMRFLLYDKDAGKYQGHSYSWIGFDEAGDWPSPIPIDKLRACLRSAKGIPPVFRAAGNPGGVGHNWLKMRYIDPSPPYQPFYAEAVDPVTEQVVKTQRVFIPSLLDDNKILLANDPHYWMRIVDSPFEVPFSWRIDRCLDWGSAKPFSVQWWAESDGSECPNGVSYPPGTLFLINEWYGWQKGQPNVGLRLSIKQVAEGIHEREDEWKLTGRVKSGPADLPVTPEGESIGVEFKKLGLRWRPANKQAGSRVTGVQLMRTRLQADLERPLETPGLWVFNTCRQFIRTVPILPRSERNIEDVDTDAEDHAWDSTMYRLLAGKRLSRIVEVVGF
jgi:hypothetical protein